MRSRFALAGALAAALAAAPSQGAPRWFNDYSEALKVSQETGWPMLIAFVVGEEGKIRDLKRLLAKPKLARYSRAFLFCYVEVQIVNNTVAHGLFAKYRPPRGAVRFPMFFWADCSEKTLAQTMDSKEDNLDHFFKVALHKHGPVADPKKLREALSQLKRADKLYEAGKYGLAARLYREIVDLKFKAPPVTAATEKLAKIEAMATQELEAARKDIEDKAYAGAVRRLAALEREFATTEAAQEAGKELETLRKLPEAQDAFAALEKGEGEPAPTSREPDDEEVAIDRFTDEELDALDEMAEGKEPGPTPRPAADTGRAARRLLALARNWIANKRPDKAKALLNQVVEEHPGTIYADQAKALLAQLK